MYGKFCLWSWWLSYWIVSVSYSQYWRFVALCFFSMKITSFLFNLYFRHHRTKPNWNIELIDFKLENNYQDFPSQIDSSIFSSPFVTFFFFFFQNFNKFYKNLLSAHLLQLDHSIILAGLFENTTSIFIDNMIARNNTMIGCNLALLEPPHQLPTSARGLDTRCFFLNTI